MSTSINQTSLDNGLTVIHQEMPWLSSVSFTILLPYGASHDPKGHEGATSVLHDWLFRGANGLSSKEISNSLDSLGTRRGGGTGKEASTFSGSCLLSSFDESLKLFALSLIKPNLDNSEFNSARLLAEQELESLQDSPSQLLFKQLSKEYFGSSHSNSSYGTAQGLSNLSTEFVKDLAKKHLSPKGAIIAVAGGIKNEDLIETVRKYFSDWQGNEPISNKLSLNPVKQSHLIQESSQVHIALAYPAVSVKEKGWYENALAISVLSGGMGARLFTEVREKRGLVYSVSAFSRVLKNHGYTMAYAGTTPEKADETIEVLTNELRNISNGVKQNELERARIGLLSQMVMQAESTGSKASTLANDYYLLARNRSPEEIKTALNEINLEQLNDFLSSYKPEFRILSLGPKEIKKVVL